VGFKKKEKKKKEGCAIFQGGDIIPLVFLPVLIHPIHDLPERCFFPVGIGGQRDFKISIKEFVF
jgi:hypothetical protein